MRSAFKICAVLFVLGALWQAAPRVESRTAQTEPSREGVEFFEKKIRPLLDSQCLACHGAKTPAGGLRLDTREGLLKGGNSGQSVILPGDPERSLLIKAIRYNDAKLQMPPTGRLSPEQIADFETWIRIGAPDPRRSAAAIAPVDPVYDFKEASKFWSLRPVRNQAPPAVRNAAWGRTPIDRFILARLEAKGLRPVADADRRTLLRRATFDLTGLPPTPQEVEAFLKDSSPRAFEKVIDRLLASPHYGERWGRHWLDVVRYADTAGDNSDFPIAAGFRYRNYVIKSFNENKPYDRFIREQIAGDLQPADNEAKRHEGIIATGYLAMSRRFGSRNKEFHLTIEDTIDNLGKTFLGLSVSCARCHDHKYDPIPQRDYYALYGIFNSSRYAFPGAEIYPHPADMIPLATGAPAGSFTRWQRELTELDDRKEQLTSERGNAARNRAQKEREEKQSAETKGGAKINESGNGQSAPKAVASPATYPPYRERPADFDRDAMNSSLVRGSLRTSEEIDAELAQVKARITGLGNQVPLVEKAYAVVEGHPANARLHRKGDPKLLGDEVPRGFLQILGGRRLPDGYGGSGRDQLAGWIADPANPLTARVMVNRIWEYHFGKGIVTSPNDFGARGQAPSHPELLDYLAARFISGGWSIKKMHRLIMTSRVYQLSVANDARNARVDLANAWYWRFDRRRLSAEEIRDAMLAVSGALDPTIGGAHPFPPERDWRFTQHKQFFALYDHNRRSVYLMQQRLKKHPLMEVFDGPDTNSSTALRPLSTTPVQALYLMNDPFVHAQADRFATRVILAYSSMPERIDYACRLAYGRAASPHEVSEAAAYIAQLSGALEEANAPEEGRLRAAFASYLRVLLSSNEFLYLD